MDNSLPANDCLAFLWTNQLERDLADLIGAELATISRIEKRNWHRNLVTCQYSHVPSRRLRAKGKSARGGIWGYYRVFAPALVQHSSLCIVHFKSLYLRLNILFSAHLCLLVSEVLRVTSSISWAKGTDAVNGRVPLASPVRVIPRHNQELKKRARRQSALGRFPFVWLRSYGVNGDRRNQTENWVLSAV